MDEDQKQEYLENKMEILRNQNYNLNNLNTEQEDNNNNYEEEEQNKKKTLNSKEIFELKKK